MDCRNAACQQAIEANASSYRSASRTPRLPEGDATLYRRLSTIRLSTARRLWTNLRHAHRFQIFSGVFSRRSPEPDRALAPSSLQTA